MDEVEAIKKKVEQIAEDKKSLEQRTIDAKQEVTAIFGKINELLEQLGGNGNVVTFGPRKPMHRMERSEFKCPKCDRSFGHKLHLGRHMSATHKRGRRAKVTAQRKAS